MIMNRADGFTVAGRLRASTSGHKPHKVFSDLLNECFGCSDCGAPAQTQSHVKARSQHMN